MTRAINPNTRSAAKLPDWLSPREFALWAGVNEETVRRWLRAGTVQGHKIGPRLWRIPRSEAEKAVEVDET